jgi:hypothetical protein
MNENTGPKGKGGVPTAEAIEAVIRKRYWMLIDDKHSAIDEIIDYDDGGGFTKDEGGRGPERAEWSRDFVIETLDFAEANGCSRNAAIEAMHYRYLQCGHHVELASRKRIFNRYHRKMRIHNFCIAVMNNDIERAVHEAQQSRSVRNRYLGDLRNSS